MATINYYQTAKLYVGGSTAGTKQINHANSAAGAWKLQLVNGYTFNNDHSVESQITNEVSGLANYVVGGVDLTNITWTIDTSGTATFDAADVAVTASGTAIDADGAVIIYASGASGLSAAPLYAFIDFVGTSQAGDTTTFKITFNADGITKIT